MFFVGCFNSFITFSFSVIFVCSIFDIDIAVCVCDFFFVIVIHSLVFVYIIV